MYEDMRVGGGFGSRVAVNTSDLWFQFLGIYISRVVNAVQDLC